MAQWQNNVPITGTGSGRAYIEINTSYYQVDVNTWHVDFNVYYRVRNGWNIARNASGGGNYGWSAGGPWGSSGVYPADYLIFAAGYNVGVDVNGNASYGHSAGINLDSNSPYNSVSTSGSEGFPRIPQAPAFSSLIADTIKPTSARMGIEISSYGHGTSANFNMYYRKQGDSTWIDMGNQGDAAGYNYWTATGLKPGKTYEYICNAWNNNGDFAQTGIQTFKTQPISGMISVMKGMMQ